MKKLVIVLIGIWVPLLLHSQQLEYLYDAAGNRVSRTILLSQQGTNLKSADATPFSFQETIGNKKIRIFPNPVHYELTVSVTNYTVEMEGQCLLYSMTGELVASQKISSDLTILAMSKLNSGSYLLSIVVSGEKSVWKVIKE